MGKSTEQTPRQRSEMSNNVWKDAQHLLSSGIASYTNHEMPLNTCENV